MFVLFKSILNTLLKLYYDVKYKVIEKEKKNENFPDGNILTIFLIFWPFSSWTFLFLDILIKCILMKKSVYTSKHHVMRGNTRYLLNIITHTFVLIG